MLAIHRNQIVSQLRKTGLSETAALQISYEVRVRSFEEGECIYRRGQEVNLWFFLMNGTIGSGVCLDGNGFSVNQIFPTGSWVGEEYLISKTPCNADYVCFSDVVAYALPVSFFQKLFHSEVSFAKWICRSLAKRECRSGELIAVYKVGSAQHKVTLSLAFLVESIIANLSGVNHSALESQAISIYGKQNFVASFCGVSRAVFSGFVQHLMSAGFLRVYYGKIEFLKINAWLGLLKKVRKNDYHFQDFVNHSALDELEACTEFEIEYVCGPRSLTSMPAKALEARA
ncbi:MAG: cyclic nucleotide-binding domain-containing protein [Rhodoferax sp.]|nr:cyclic nucleotide-binding domain-containing protein [Rhodoferax sp.]